MKAVLGEEGLGALFDALRAEGWAVIGPTVRDGAVVYDALDGPDALPTGWTDEQAPGRYRLVRRGDDRRFGYAVGPHSWKSRLFPPRERLSTATRTADGLSHALAEPDPARRAFLGVRACELAAIGVQDRVFLGGRYRETRYAAHRERSLLVAVNCTDPSGLCFCASTGTGPRVRDGADLVLTELPDRFVVEALTDRGRAVAVRLPLRPADAGDEAAVDEVERTARGRMGRAVDTAGLPELLLARWDHARWDEVAARCLSCGNCTQVCPTCFCSSVEEVSDLDATHSERVRTWDSCFTPGHAKIHGADLRPGTKQRYRQWLTHKFGTWVSQFGTSGCVGCGRCVAWCPVGIDVTAELAALREGDGPPPGPLPAPPPPGPATPEDLVPRTAVVVEARRETGDVVTLALRAPEVAPADHGQFHVVGLPGVGEVPISVSGARDGLHELTIRRVGPVTEALCAATPGTALGLRGPYGRAWPVAEVRGRPVVVVAGGIGLAPLRSAIRAMAADPIGYPDVRVFVGARRPDDRLYVDERAAWTAAGRVTVEESVDRADAGWTGSVGFVTRLLGPRSVPAGAVAFVVGPEKMMEVTVRALAAAGVPADRVWLSMERHMKCAAGFCGRCQYAHWFVCKDGPVFRADVLAPVFGRDGV